MAMVSHISGLYDVSSSLSCFSYVTLLVCVTGITYRNVWDRPTLKAVHLILYISMFLIVLIPQLIGLPENMYYIVHFLVFSLTKINRFVITILY
jgi:hypothetical protein